ncbi:MAG: discoidin domain-containing protein [Armatimonadota bacterium]
MKPSSLSISDRKLAIRVLGGVDTVEWHASEILARTIKERTGIDVQMENGSNTAYTIVVGTQSDYEIREYSFDHQEVLSLKNDGFYINTEPDEYGRLYIIGDTPSGAVAGIGKLLRISQYADNSLSIPSKIIISNPEMPVRGMYFATHFGNFYEAAPLDDVDKIIEDLALWGTNSLMVWFDQHQFNDFNDPAAKKMIGRLRHMGNTAHSLGMKFGLTALANEGYGGSPPELRIPVLNPGNYGVEICPSFPEGLDLITKNLEQVALAFPKVDTVWIWPYDQGGCWCEKCLPWGGNGFLKAAERLAPMYKKHFPNVEIWISTWKMDYFANTQGEIDGVIRFMRHKKPSWLAGIITGQDEYATQKSLMNRPQPDRYPLASFPEISMYRMYPWGGFGATALPEFNEKVEHLMSGIISGGWPYSEGIYEDLSKYQWISFYWNPARKTDDILREYASYYLNPIAADDFVKLAYLLEKTHDRHNWYVKSLEGADEAWRLAKKIDSTLDEWSRKSWRWRLLYLRAAIDNILQNHPITSDEAKQLLKPYCDEIISICHLTATHLRPPDFPKPMSPDNIAFGKPVTASSTLPEYEGSEKYLVDGVSAQDNPMGFWVSDPSKENTSSITIDLGKQVEVDEIRLQFRPIDGKYWFVPSSMSFSVSSDGTNFDTISIMYLDGKGGEAGPFVSTTNLPKENSSYTPELWRYRVAGGSRMGRYIRVELGQSQRVEGPFKGTLELTEIEITGTSK